MMLTPDSGTQSRIAGSDGQDGARAVSSLSRRPIFTTSLSDFALPPRLTSPSPAAVSHLTALASGTQSGPVAPALFPSHRFIQRGLGSYALRPRSSLSRTIIAASDDQDGDGDDEDEDVFHGRRPSSHFSPNSRLHGDAYRSSKDRDRDRSDRMASSYSRMGSMPPLSPRSFLANSDRGSPFRRGHVNHDRATSPIPRRGPHMSPEPWTLDVVHHEEDDVELDLDGMDMKMDDLNADAPEVMQEGATRVHIESPQLESFAVTPAPVPSPALRAASSSGSRPERTQSFSGRPSSGSARTAKSSTERCSKLNHCTASVPGAPDGDVRGVGGSVQPLWRVFQLLKDEAKPVESEVASEAKLTKRLSVLHKAASRRSRENSPFTGPNMASQSMKGPDPALDTSQQGLGQASADAAYLLEDPDHKDDDDLLTNVGFESDALSTSDDSELDQAPNATTSLLGAVSETMAAGEQVPVLGSQRLTSRFHVDGDGDADMAEDKIEHPHCGSVAPIPTPGRTTKPFVDSLSRTPPRRFQTSSGSSPTNISPTLERASAFCGATSPTPTTPVGTVAPTSLSAMSGDQHEQIQEQARSSAASASGAATAGSKNLYMSRKRTGSAWMDFRNSPSVTASSGSLEKRHQRLYGHSYRSKRAVSAAASEAATLARGLSTSPAAVAGAAGILCSGPASSSPCLKSSASGTANTPLGVPAGRSGFLTKRKHGFASDSPSSDGAGGVGNGVSGGGSGMGVAGNERFEPYANSAYKRRAVSPLNSMNISLYGHGGRGKARSPSLTPGPSIVSIGSTGMSSPSLTAAARRTPASSQHSSYPNSNVASPTHRSAQPMVYQHSHLHLQHYAGCFPVVSGGSNGSASGAGSSTASNGGSPLLLSAVAPRAVAGAARRPLTMAHLRNEGPPTGWGGTSSRLAGLHRPETSGSGVPPHMRSQGSTHLPEAFSPSSSSSSSSSFTGAATVAPGSISSFGEDGRGLGPSVVQTSDRSSAAASGGTLSLPPSSLATRRQFHGDLGGAESEMFRDDNGDASVGLGLQGAGGDGGEPTALMIACEGSQGRSRLGGTNELFGRGDSSPTPHRRRI